MGETAAFALAAQQAFEENGSWDMASLESGLRQALMRDGCHILEALLNQPAALGEKVHCMTTARAQCRPCSVPSG